MKLELELNKAQEAFKNGSQEFKDFLITAYGAEHFTNNWQTAYSNACKQLGYTEMQQECFSGLPSSQANRFFKRHVLATIIEARRGNWIPDITNHNQRKYYVYVYHSDSNGFMFGVNYWYDYSIVGSDLMLHSEELCNELIADFTDLILEVYV